MHPDAIEWAAQCCRSESDKPHEWPPILWVIRNRRESRRYPDTWSGVVLQRLQFSYYNRFIGRGLTLEETFAEAQSGYPGDVSGWSENNFDRALACAEYVANAPRWAAPFSENVHYFWSPVSMVPKGSDPSWSSKLRVFTLSGIDPERFKFAE